MEAFFCWWWVLWVAYAPPPMLTTKKKCSTSRKKILQPMITTNAPSGNTAKFVKINKCPPHPHTSPRQKKKLPPNAHTQKKNASTTHHSMLHQKKNAPEKKMLPPVILHPMLPSRKKSLLIGTKIPIRIASSTRSFCDCRTCSINKRIFKFKCWVVRSMMCYVNP